MHPNASYFQTTMKTVTQHLESSDDVNGSEKSLHCTPVVQLVIGKMLPPKFLPLSIALEPPVSPEPLLSVGQSNLVTILVAKVSLMVSPSHLCPTNAHSFITNTSVVLLSKDFSVKPHMQFLYLEGKIISNDADIYKVEGEKSLLFLLLITQNWPMLR